MNSSIFQLGDLTVNTATRVLSRKDGRPARLRNKSKDVLARLLENPNHTVTKDEILDSVWSDVIVSDESLVQCVADIRRLIGKDARHIVETIPRQGYRINVTAQKAPAARSMSIVAIVAFLAAIGAAGLILWPDPATPPENEPKLAEAPNPTSPPGTASVEAYLEVLKGRVSANRFSFDESLIAERHFRHAIELDPNYARAYAELTTLLAIRFENDWTVLEDADKQKALYFAEKSLSLDRDLWLAHYAMGRLKSVFADFEAAEGYLETAMSLQPDNEDARAYLGVVRNLRGDSENAAAILQQVVASHPKPPYWYYYGLGHAQFNLRRYVEAKEALETCLELAENSPYCLRYLLGVYGATGDRRQGEIAAQIYSSMGFELSISAILNLIPMHPPDDRAQLKWALEQAGLPE